MKIYHLTSNLLLHYLAKVKSSTQFFGPPCTYG